MISLRSMGRNVGLKTHICAYIRQFVLKKLFLLIVRDGMSFSCSYSGARAIVLVYLHPLGWGVVGICFNTLDAWMSKNSPELQFRHQ